MAGKGLHCHLVEFFRRNEFEVKDEISLLYRVCSRIEICVRKDGKCARNEGKVGEKSPFLDNRQTEVLREMLCDCALSRGKHEETEVSLRVFDWHDGFLVRVFLLGEMGLDFQKQIVLLLAEKDGGRACDALEGGGLFSAPEEMRMSLQGIESRK